MNWFVQLCLSLEYIHGRKILHRDIKSSNVFLTRNNTIKLGDFGISKVLENTNDQAMTVQGTPYYMSPEVCQNKPYNYKSDIWALGCILYELCTLQHAFHAENLLGLVYKIVQDKHDPIPSSYSDEMKNLVALILNKNDKERPSALEILKIPFVQLHMRKFVESQGKITLIPLLSVKKDIQPEQAIQDNILLKTKDKGSLTAKELMRLKKEQRARDEFEKMAKAAALACETRAQAKNIKQSQQFMTSMTSLKGTIPQDRRQVTNSRFEETEGLDQSRDMDETVNNRTI